MIPRNQIIHGTSTCRRHTHTTHQYIYHSWTKNTRNVVVDWGGARSAWRNDDATASVELLPVRRLFAIDMVIGVGHNSTRRVACMLGWIPMEFCFLITECRIEFFIRIVLSETTYFHRLNGWILWRFIKGLSTSCNDANLGVLRHTIPKSVQDTLYFNYNAPRRWCSSPRRRRSLSRSYSQRCNLDYPMVRHDKYKEWGVMMMYNCILVLICSMFVNLLLWSNESTMRTPPNHHISSSFESGQVLINEVAVTAIPNVCFGNDYVELINTGVATANLSGWSLYDSDGIIGWGYLHYPTSIHLGRGRDTFLLSVVMTLVVSVSVLTMVITLPWPTSRVLWFLPPVSSPEPDLPQPPINARPMVPMSFHHPHPVISINFWSHPPSVSPIYQRSSIE